MIYDFVDDFNEAANSTVKNDTKSTTPKKIIKINNIPVYPNTMAEIIHQNMSYTFPVVNTTSQLKNPKIKIL